jgi:hypothetical protein
LLNLRFVSGAIVRWEIPATKTIADVKRELLSHLPELKPATLKLIALSSIVPNTMQLADLYFQVDGSADARPRAAPSQEISFFFEVWICSSRFSSSRARFPRLAVDAAAVCRTSGRGRHDKAAGRSSQ